MIQITKHNKSSYILLVENGYAYYFTHYYTSIKTLLELAYVLHIYNKQVSVISFMRVHNPVLRETERALHKV